MNVGRIDDTHSIASLMKRDRERDPVAASGFKHNQRLSWQDGSAGECGLEGGKALRRLGKATSTLRGRVIQGPGGGEGGGSNVDANKQTIVRNRCVHRSPKLKRKPVPWIAAIVPRDTWSEPHDTVLSAAIQGGGGTISGTRSKPQGYPLPHHHPERFYYTRVPG